MVSYIPKIANAVLSFRVSHKLGLTSYHEVLDLMELSRSPLKVSEQPHGNGYAAFFVDAGCGSVCSASILAMTGAIAA